MQKQDLTLEKIKIETIEPDFSLKIFNENQVSIKALLPNIKQEKISFHIRNSNTATANALRRVVMGELKVKYLTCDIPDIDTDEEFIKLNELIDRINYIPINQDLDVHSEFSLNIAATDIKSETLIVHSSELIMNKGNKVVNLPMFANTFRIAELRPGKYLIIPKIRIVENYGYNTAAATLTSETEYQITDYIPAYFINDKANFISKRVKLDELISLMKKYKIKIDVDPYELYLKSILIIPNKSYQSLLTDKQKEKIKNFDIIIENPESSQIKNLKFDDEFLKGYQSTEIKAQNFFLSIATYGNIGVKQMMNLTCENIKKRLTDLKEAVIQKEKDLEINANKNDIKHETEGLVSILRDNIKTTIIIRGEDHTISNLLKLAIFELDPNIGLINDTSEHPLNRTTMLNIMHAESIKILINAIDVCIRNFTIIQKHF